MDYTSLWFTLLSCLFFMGIIAFVAYRKTKNQVSDSSGYFLAGRGLTGGFIAGSLLLTNLSAEQLVGLNGQAYRANLSNMAWEVTAPIAIVIMALYLLPRYLGGSVTTLPEFLHKRFDSTVRLFVVVLFMLGYIFVTIPSMLYSGALAVLRLFNVPELLGISFTSAVWLVVWVVGLIGAAYAIFGGLRAVAISDTLNGIGLLIVGLLMPVLGFFTLGDGNILNGMKEITVNNAEKLNAIGGPDDDVPFGSIFTGLVIANLFYWASNQYVIQRTLGAKSLKEGQKGVIFSGFYKLLVPFMMMVPGIIAFHLYGDNLQNVDLAYPTLVNALLPTYLSGFFLAVLLGTVLSSYNSLLNSAATMFALDVYKPRAKEEVSDEKLIKVSKIFGTIIAFITFFISPLLMNAPTGLWNLIRQFTGFFNIPIVTILLAGALSKFVPAIAAKVVIIFHIISYYMLVWGTDHLFGFPVNINYIHIYGILFAIEVLIMLVLRYWKPRKEAYVFKKDPKVGMTPWKHALPITVVLLASMCAVYIVFSPVGLAYPAGVVSPVFWPAIGALAFLTVICYLWALKRWTKKYQAYLFREASDEEKTLQEAKVSQSD
ncbi:solute:sodium symporter family transporter [Sediminibacillus massiliensis]|uniref:solute:sodium symporter family transporter n=1 Tax=Sediminibacillus massiliensis TaxID=1926277 RepID=UPI0009888046|nr:solute:sodium symporter family transporter [Sediminibacillus massiliensis]